MSKLQLGRPKVYRSPLAGGGSGGGGGAAVAGGGGGGLPRPGGTLGEGGGGDGGGGFKPSSALVARRPGGQQLSQTQAMAPLIPDTSYYESRAEAVSEIEVACRCNRNSGGGDSAPHGLTTTHDWCFNKSRPRSHFPNDSPPQTSPPNPLISLFILALARAGAHYGAGECVWAAGRARGGPPGAHREAPRKREPSHPHCTALGRLSTCRGDGNRSV